MSYEAKWKAYRRSLWLFVAIWLSYVPGVGLIWMGAMRLFDSGTAAHLVFGAAGAWMLAFAVAWGHLIMFGCPRCGGWFFGTWYFLNPFARRCVHCRLPKWAAS